MRAAYRPIVERLAVEAVAEIEGGGVQVADGYELPASDLAALRARRAEDGYLERMRATYLGGVDGWVEDCLALTRPWGFDLAEIRRPTSIWYGVHDVLGPPAHAEYLLSAVPDAQRYELAGGHVLGDADLAAIYRWLTEAST